MTIRMHERLQGDFPPQSGRSGAIPGGSNETRAIRRPPTSFSATAIEVRRRSGEFSPRPTSRRLIGLDARQRELVMPRVVSSMMTAVEYDEDDKTLDVAFTSGKTYRYFEVPASVYKRLLKAESKGQFFNERIKDIFPFVRLRGRTGS